MLRNATKGSHFHDTVQHNPKVIQVTKSTNYRCLSAYQDSKLNEASVTRNMHHIALFGLFKAGYYPVQSTYH